MSDPIHHYHRRKRIYQKHEPYPHPNKWKRYMDKVIYFVGVFAQVMTIPQIITIWASKNAAGVSPISWGAYFISTIFWVGYGVMHKEKPIIIIYSLAAIFNFIVVVGALLYG